MEAGANYRARLKTRKLLKIRDAETARTAETAARMYTACTRSISKENRQIHLSAEFLPGALKRPFFQRTILRLTQMLTQQGYATRA